jgi:hypothetical protein
VGLSLRGFENSFGGAVANNSGGSVDVIDCRFVHDLATAEDANGYDDSAGGAIANNGGGVLEVTGSSFVDDSAANGGAISNADADFYAFYGNGQQMPPTAQGTVRITASVFVGNAATGYGGGYVGTGNGGAVDNADTGLYDGDETSGTVSISASTFSSNSAGENGGAISNAEADGYSFDGPAGTSGTSLPAAGSLEVSSSTFYANHTLCSPGTTGCGDGGAIANAQTECQGGEFGGTCGTSTGTLAVWSSTFASNTATGNGPEVSSSGTTWSAANIFDGSCVESALHDEGYNLSRDRTCVGVGPHNVVLGQGLAVSSLADHGGPMATALLMPVPDFPAPDIPWGAVVALAGRQVDVCPARDERGQKAAPGEPCWPGAVQGSVWYAYADGSASDRASCPPSTGRTEPCGLARALALARPGDIVALATPGRAGAYHGNWTIRAASLAAPLYIVPAPGVIGPIVDGNAGHQTGCSTPTCSNAVLTVAPATDVSISGVTVQSGDNTATGTGGAIAVDQGAVLTASSMTFSHNRADYGGAIADSGGVVTVSTSTFAGDEAPEGGAIAVNARGTLAVWASTFTDGMAPVANLLADGFTGTPGTVWLAADILDGSCERAVGRGDDQWHDEGYNVAASASCLHGGPGDIDAGPGLGTMLAPPALNGGSTATVLLLPGNPAYRAVPEPTTVELNGETVQLCPATDQRGTASVAGHACAAGALQLSLTTDAYAYASGAAPSPARACPESTKTAQECTLGEALDLAVAGDTVLLATPGRVRAYRGAWRLDTLGRAPVRIRPAPGVAAPVLVGTNNGRILTLAGGGDVAITGVTFRDGDAGPGASGGAIEATCTLALEQSTFVDNTAGIVGGAVYSTAPLTATASTFVGNHAQDGGAIDQAAGGLTVSLSRFSGNSSYLDGGAVDIEQDGGTVSASLFTGNASGFGGAISDDGGTLDIAGSRFLTNSAYVGGALNFGEQTTSSPGQVTRSTFLANNASSDGGAIANGDPGLTDASIALSVNESTFAANTAGGNGGGIDNADDYQGYYQGETAVLMVRGSTFSDNAAKHDGGAIDNGDYGDHGKALNIGLVVTQSTFAANRAGRDGGGIDNADHMGQGLVTASGSTFSANTGAKGDAIDDAGAAGTADPSAVFVAADIFAGTCAAGTGPWHDGGYNVSVDGSCLGGGTGDRDYGPGLSHLMGPLADNGGPTKTILPLAGNPSIGAVPMDASALLNGRTVRLCPTIDQRGRASFAGRPCNAGSVQQGVEAVGPGPARSSQRWRVTGEFAPDTGAMPARPSWNRPSSSGHRAALSRDRREYL